MALGCAIKTKDPPNIVIIILVMEQEQQDSKKRKQEYNRRYYEKNKEKLRADAREYGKEHAEEKNAKRRKRRRDDPVYAQEQYKKTAEWRVVNRELELPRRREKYAEEFNTIEGRLKNMKKNALSRNLPWLLSDSEAGWFLILLCHYCGAVPKPIHGIDRVDSRLGYDLDNVAPCCKWCNWSKGETDYDKFMVRLDVIAGLKEQEENVIDAQPLRDMITNYLAVYRLLCKKNNRAWPLTDDQASKMFLSVCHYCRWRPSPLNGIDRVDNNKGYELDNIVPCCQWCNRAKKNRSVDEFRQYLANLIQYVRDRSAKRMAEDMM